MIVTTTNTIEGRPVREYLGIVTGEAIIGANIFRDILAGIRDVVGGRTRAYEDAFRGAREEALREMTKGGFGFHEVWVNLVPWIKGLDLDEIKARAGLPARSGE